MNYRLYIKAVFIVSDLVLGFPGTLAGEKSTFYAWDSCSIPGLGRSPGEGIGYPLQYSWTPLLALMVKNMPAMRGDLYSVPGLERSPGGGHGSPLQYSCLENPRGQRSLLLEGYSPWGCKELDMTEWLSTT